ncbi:hypothetical protein N9B82_02910 [Saprospiraceae bacterium]|nr:hypothetical protein [Saprospiraceae bacterium]
MPIYLKINVLKPFITLCLVSILVICSLSVNAQDKPIQESKTEKAVNCDQNPRVPILKTGDQVFTAGELSINSFFQLKELLLFSPCTKKDYQIRGFRMVGAAKGKDPIVIAIKGSQITQKHLDALKPLGNSFSLFLEDIKAVDADAKFEHSVSFKVR